MDHTTYFDPLNVAYKVHVTRTQRAPGLIDWHD